MAPQLGWKWDAAAVAGGRWKRADVIGQAGARGKYLARTVWQLDADGLPPMERTERATGKVVRLTGLSGAGAFPMGKLTVPAYCRATILLDAGQVVTAFPELTLSCAGERSFRVSTLKRFAVRTGPRTTA